MAWGPISAPDIRRDVIVFDGDCVLCSRMRATVHRRDPEGIFLLTDMHAPVGRALARRFGVNPDDRKGQTRVENLKSQFVISSASGAP